MRFDVIIIGGGPAGVTVAEKLQEAGLGCALINTGLSIHNVSYSGFTRLGGLHLNGDTVCEAKVDNGLVSFIRTENLPAEDLVADCYVLASGKFFGRGLRADMDKVYEPVFGLDVEYSKDHSEWFSEDFCLPQPFLKFGVKADSDFHPYLNGTPVDNLFVCGEVREGVSCAEDDNVARVVAEAEKVSQLIIEKKKCHAGE